ncbi:MAG: phytoene/squalene synthase family protein [Planctomycetia bacterium]|nr:phytoene/squalene synthase family protein [Planctomycetia bacterium]
METRAASGGVATAGAAAPAVPLDAAYAWCEDLTRREARNFYWPIRGLERDRRRAMCAVYAFSRAADDIADEPGIEDRPGRFADFRRRLEGAYAGTPEGEIFVALGDAARRFRLRREDLAEIVEGAEQDLRVTRYGTWEELKAYCHKVASAVGLVCIEIFGYSDPAARGHAEMLGLGMQLTHLLRDVAEDAQRGRIYLPAEDLARFDVREEDVLAGRMTPAFARLMAFEVARARELFASSEGLFPLLRRKARFCPLAIRGMYEGILGKIEKRGHDVFAGRAGLSTAGKLLCVMRAWFRAWTY